jgi:hypothetical protein
MSLPYVQLQDRHRAQMFYHVNIESGSLPRVLPGLKILLKLPFKATFYISVSRI